MNAGDRLGGYEILGVIGAGGMGEVYRARDARLQRDVAIKVLPADVTTNPRRRLRFEREARALAAINHPNIATIHEAGRDPSGLTFLVMELVHGDDLSARLARGGIPLGEALPIARQLADALAAAHEAGIVHRDFKPGNIKLRPDGTVKVLDFGLARSLDSEDADLPAEPSAAGRQSDSGSNPGMLSPTLTLAGQRTADGAVIGTAAYMAPEQAKGQPVDKRADIWAFGVVLFEMLAGRRPFDDADPSDALARALTTEPPWAALPAETPISIRRLLARCLTKDRRRRLHDIGDARLEIDEALAPSLPPEAREAARPTRRPALWLAVAAALVAGVALSAIWWRPPPDAGGPSRVKIGVEPAVALDAGGTHPTVVLTSGGAHTALAWTPDGRAVGFIGARDGKRQVFLRQLGQDAATPIPGTEDALAFAFSPDGQSVLFRLARGLYRVGIAGGPAVDVLRYAGDVSGLHFGATRIVFTDGGLLSVTSTANATAVPLTVQRELVRHSTPFLLPDESAVLYTEHARQWTSGDEQVMALPLVPNASPKVILRDAADARYLSTGHLAFLRRGVLHAIAFDPRALEVRGEPVALVSNVSQAVAAWDSTDLTLAGHFAVSPQGSLAYASAPLPTYPEHALVSVDRDGRMVPLDAPPRGYRSHIETSPDGRRIGVSVQSATDLHVFAYDLQRGTLTRIADGLPGESLFASWSRTNDIAAGVIAGGRITAAVVRPDASSPVRGIAATESFWPSSLSASGLLAGMKESDIWVYPTASGGSPVRVMQSPATETQPMWSPDGRWLAYTSDVTGAREIQLRPYPGPGEAVQVSTAGGSGPAWNPAGGELFYVEPGSAGRHRLMSVRLNTDGHPGRPVPLFTTPPDSGFGLRSILTPYAVSADGRRFFAVRILPRSTPVVTDIQLVLNWADEVRARLR